MTPSEEIRLRVIEALMAKAPQSPDVAALIERARIVTAYVTDNPQGPARQQGTISIVADKPAPRKA